MIVRGNLKKRIFICCSKKEPVLNDRMGTIAPECDDFFFSPKIFVFEIP